MNNKCKHGKHGKHGKNGGRGKRGKLYMTFLFPGTWHKFLITRSCGVNEAYEWKTCRFMLESVSFSFIALLGMSKR